MLGTWYATYIDHCKIRLFTRFHYHMFNIGHKFGIYTILALWCLETWLTSFVISVSQGREPKTRILWTWSVSGKLSTALYIRLLTAILSTTRNISCYWYWSRRHKNKLMNYSSIIMCMFKQLSASLVRFNIPTFFASQNTYQLSVAYKKILDTVSCTLYGIIKPFILLLISVTVFVLLCVSFHSVCLIPWLSRPLLWRYWISEYHCPSQ
jgi:hypothetical protein